MNSVSAVVSAMVAGWLALPYFALFVFGVTVLVGMSLVATAKRRANRHFDHLMHGFNTVTAKLNEAEKFGHFGSFTWDFEKGYTFWSEEMFTLFGLIPKQKAPTIEKVIAMTYEEDRVEAHSAWQRAQTQPGEFTITFRVVALSGQVRYLQLQGTTTLGSEHTPALIQGIAHDVTKEKEVDRAKTEFVSLASHQLKTPLTAIGWLAEGLLSGDKGALNAEQRTYIDSIHETNRHMTAIVNDLLNVSRIELKVLDIRPEDLDIVEFSKIMVRELRHSAEVKHIDIRERYEDGLPHSVADKNLLRMIFQNLLTNAIKYTLGGGSVEIEISHGSVGDSLFLRVTDTGIGIPKNAREHMFEKLYRADNAQRIVVDGTGLGLYVVKTILEKVHGGISFESVEGTGTTFFVTIPRIWEKTT
ncbi:MAG: ATP-binding protein [bacterium]|nr:ATP-binding protein [bacterium]